MQKFLCFIEEDYDIWREEDEEYKLRDEGLPSEEEKHSEDQSDDAKIVNDFFNI